MGDQLSLLRVMLEVESERARSEKRRNSGSYFEHFREDVLALESYGAEWTKSA